MSQAAPPGRVQCVGPFAATVRFFPYTIYILSVYFIYLYLDLVHLEYIYILYRYIL